MKKITLLISGIITFISGYSQINNSSVFAESITDEELKEHVYFLAGKECEGRETGEKGQKIAANYLADYFKQLGIKPITDNYFQIFPIPGDDRCSHKLSFNGKELVHEKDFLAFCGFKENINYSLNQIYFLGYGIDDEKYTDYKNTKIDGNWIVILDSEPLKNNTSILNPKLKNTNWSSNIELKIETAEKFGAEGVIIISEEYLLNKMDNENYLLLESKYNSKHIPYLYITKNIADKYLLLKFNKTVSDIKNSISKTKKSVFIQINELQIDMSLNIPPVKKTGENVLAYIEGTDLKDELIIITAHYDHLGIHDGQVYFGADDDGSGTSAILEIAEAFMLAKSKGFGPRRSILIMPVSGEEKGLWGSEFYTDNPVFPLNKTIANLNIDMIGRIDKFHSDPNYVYLIGSDKLSSDLHNISEKVNSTYTQLKLDYKYNDPNDPNQFYYRSDHYNFAKNNIPVIFYFTGVHEDYHKPTDSPDKLDYKKVENITKLVFYTAWDLANRDERIKVDKENSFKNWR